MKSSFKIMKMVSVSSMVFLALFLAACGGGGEDGETTVADEGESQAFTTQTSGVDGKVSITFDSGKEGTFLITDTSDNPLQGIDSYIYKDSKGATIIASDPAGNYATKVYSAEHFSTQQITLSSYDSNGISITNSYIIPDHLDTSALGAVDTSWEQYAGSIDDVISFLDITGTSFGVVVDIIHSTVSASSFLVSAILFEDIKAIKGIFDWYWSDDFRYISNMNTENSLALISGGTALPYGVLIVRVEDSSGTAISGASVGISDSFLWQAETGYNGYARIERISPGTHTAEVSHSNYDNATFQADIPSAGRAEIIEIELSASLTSDTEDPSVPTGLTATAVSSSQIDLSWTTSTDDVEVTGYKVYRDGSYLKSVTTNSTSDTGLSSSTQYCYTVLAYDAAGNESDESDEACATTTSSPNTSPTASITSPSDGTYTEGDTITFGGSGDDEEDGDLTGDSLVWTSSIDGQIGTGESFTRNDLAVGTHTITLTATDSDGATGSDSVSIVVSLSPTIVGSVETLGGAVGVHVSGSYAYVSTNMNSNDNSGGLQVIDISNSANPTIVGSVDTPGFASDVYISGSYAYVADWRTSGLQVIDIHDPTNPTIVGSVSTGTFLNNVFVSGSYAYLVDGSDGWLYIFDINDPANPTSVSSMSTLDPFGSHDTYVSGAYAYVADGYYLTVIDISNPASPSIVGSLYSSSKFCSVHIAGTYAYTTCQNTLMVIDISDPTNPTLVGSDTADAGTNYGRAIYVSGSYAYVIGSGEDLSVVDVSEPTEPRVVGGVDTANYTRDVFVVGSYAYVATATNSQPSSGRLFVIDTGLQ